MKTKYLQLQFSKTLKLKPVDANLQLFDLFLKFQTGMANMVSMYIHVFLK